MQRWFELDAPQRAARIPRHPGSRPGPRRPVSLHPRERHLSSGPAGHGKRAGRKSGAKVNRISLARKTDPGKLTLRGPSSIALSNPSCHWRCVRDGMEARSRACTRPHHPPRLSFRSFSREGSRHSESRGAFHRGNRMTEGIAPWDIRQVLLITRPSFGFAVKRGRAFSTGGRCLELTAPSRDCLRLGWLSWLGVLLPGHPAAAPLRLLRLYRLAKIQGRSLFVSDYDVWEEIAAFWHGF